MKEQASIQQVVWITGASTGIGKELASRYASSGNQVAISARSRDKLSELASGNSRMESWPLDVTDAPATAKVVNAIASQWGRIDLAILNAGVWHLMDADKLDLHKVRAGVEVNYMGVMNALDALIPQMLAQGSGHIAIVASVAGFRGLPRSVAYGPTKAALINLAETLNCELAPKGITVSIINPGFVDTPMTADNPFPMPGIITTEKAAEYIMAGLARRKFEIAFPTGFALMMQALRILPDFLYFWIIRRFVMKKSG